MRSRTTKENQGSVLLIVMFMALLLFILTSTVGQSSIQNSGSSAKVLDQKRARYAAYSGLELALAKLNHEANEDFAVARPVILTGTMPENPNVKFTVTIRSNLYGDLDQSIVPKGAVYLDSQATFNDGSTTRRIGGLAGNAIQNNPKFDQAVYGAEIMMDQDSETHAYDFHKYVDWMRSIDAYDTDRTVQDSTWGSGAKVVCTTSNITVNRNSKIYGDVAFRDAPASSSGLLGGTTSTTSPPPLVAGRDYTGSRVAGTANPLPAMRPPYDSTMATIVIPDLRGTPIYDLRGNIIGYNPVTLPKGAYKSVTIPSGQPVTLEAGTYYFADDFNISGNVELPPYGQVIIYVGKKMFINGKINEGGDPARLQTYFTDEDNTPDTGETVVNPATFKVSRLQMTGARATMTVGGSNLRSKINNSQLLGSIASNKIDLLNGSKIKFDSNLAGQSTLMKSEWALTGVREH